MNFTLIHRFNKTHQPLNLKSLSHHHHHHRKASTINHPIDHCLQILRTSDHASVLQIPFYPKASRSSFVAIKALNAELNSIPQSIHSGKTLIGQMRYQWWKDAINTCFQHPLQKQPTSVNHVSIHHPVVISLRSAIEKHRLTKYHFIRLIEARQNQYLNPTYKSIESLTNHSQSTNFTILSLLFQTLGSPTTSDLSLTTLDHALHHASNAITLSTLLHSLPSSTTPLRIPSELLKCTEEDLIRVARASTSTNTTTTANPQMVSAVQETIIKIATLAWSELSACRDALSGSEHDFEKYESLDRDDRLHARASIPPPLRPLFLSLTPARTYLNRLERLHFNVFHPDLQTRDWKLPFYIGYDAFFGKV